MPQSFYNMVECIITYFYFLWDTLKSAFETIAAPFIEIIKEVFTGLQNHSDEIFNFIGEAFNFMTEYMLTAWQNIGQPIMDLIVQVIGWVRDAFAERMPEIQAFFSTFINDAKSLWENNLKPCLEAIGNFINNVLAPAFKMVFQNIILPVVDACFNGIKNLWTNSLKPILQGILDFITGVFSGNFTQAFSGIVSAVSGIFSGLITVVKAPLNAVIGLVNSFIGGLNKLSVPDWVPGIGGKGINIPSIPYLAKGTDYFKGGAAIVGEQGPELVTMPKGAKVTPNKKTENILGQGGGTFILQTILDGSVIAETIAPYSDIVGGNRLNLSKRGVLV